MTLTLASLKRARRRVEGLGVLSDGLFRLGPLKIGLDGLLAWLPGVGEAYSLGVGVGLVSLGARARLPVSVLLQAAALIGLRSLAGAPASALLGPLYPVSAGLVDVFRAHKWAADLIIRAMDQRLYVSAAEGSATALEAAETAAAAGLILVRLDPGDGAQGFSRGGR